MSPEPSRYHRQTLLPGIGEAGQRRLTGATVLIVGCGALGTVSANLLARAGVGTLVLADRDVVEWTNLQRQVLFTEAHARDGAPKADAAAETIAQVNNEVRVVPLTEDVTHLNLEAILAGSGYDHGACDVIVDGTDNFATRFLLNDAAVKLGVPYVYGGAVATHGLTMTVLPHTPEADTPWELIDRAGPCLRCVFGDSPPAGSGETCDTAGVLGPAVSVVGSIQAGQAMKVITGAYAQTAGLLRMDLWDGQFQSVDVAGAYVAGDCPCCGRREFDYLQGRTATTATALCGRNAVQLAGPTARGAGGAGKVDLPDIARRLGPHAQVNCTDRLLRANIHDRGTDYELTLFPDGRAIVRGTEQPETARGLYARFVGH